MASISGIYQIKNVVSGKIYIGSAINIKHRWQTHVGHLNKNRHPNRHLQSAWNKYGSEAFEFSILKTCFIFALIFEEQKMIDKLNPEYNLAPKAGSNLGVKLSEETKNKISASKKGVATGRIVSKETRDKISMALQGHKNNLGSKRSEETKAKMSIVQSNRSVETRAKMSQARIGKKLSQETCERLSISHMGQNVSSETRAKLSETTKAWWKNKSKIKDRETP